MENRKAKKPLNKTASKSASDDLYAAHENDPRPNALYNKNGDRKRLDAKKNSQAGLRKEWMDYYIAHGGDYEQKPKSSASLEKPETAHCPAKRTNWVALDYSYDNADQTPLYDNAERTPVSEMDFYVTYSDGSEIIGNLDKDGYCHLGDIPEGNVDVEYGKRDIDDELKSVRAELKVMLDKMVNEVAQDSTYLEQELKKRGFLERELIHTGARLKGAYDAGAGTVSTLWYVFKKGHELEAKLYKKAYRAIKNNSLDEVRDDLGTLQFTLDVAWNKVQKAYEVLQIIAEDPESRDMLISFPRRYLGAMHSTDFDQHIGALAFEVLMALLTGGGASAAAVAKSRHFSKVRILIDKLVDILKRRRLRKKKFPGQQKTSNIKKAPPLRRIRRGGIHPHKRGMRVTDDEAFAAMAKKGDIIIVRNSNPAALKFIGEPGYKAKPLKLKAKTRKGPPPEWEGLAAADPKDPNVIQMLKEQDIDLKDPSKGKGIDHKTYVERLEAEGYYVGSAKDGHVITDAAGNKYYSDYDLHGVYDGKTGKNSYSEAKRASLNGDFDAKIIQHDTHDNWPQRNGKMEKVTQRNGKVVKKRVKDINSGPQPPCTVYMPPDGTRVDLKSITAMKKFYKKHGLAADVGGWDKLYPDH